MCHAPPARSRRAPSSRWSHHGCPTTAVPPRLSHQHHHHHSNRREAEQTPVSRRQPGSALRGRHTRAPSQFPPQALKEQWPKCPSEAPPATRGPSRPANTLALVRPGREAAQQQVFPATGHRSHPASPTGDTASAPCPLRELTAPGGQQGPTEVAIPQQAGGPAPEGHQKLDACPPAVHILLEKDFPSAVPSPS